MSRQIINPMLAGKLDQINLKNLRFPILASPKLDGVRARIIDGVVKSRRMLDIPNKFTQKRFGRKALNYLDGELIVGSSTDLHVCDNTRSGVMSRDGDPSVVFHVFDYFAFPDEPFRDRLNKVHTIIQGFSTTPLSVVPHTMMKDLDELMEYEARLLVLGYEGVMLRSLIGPYKGGRSTLREGWLMKLKRFEDSEATIIGFVELQHNTNETTTGKLGQTKRSSHKAGRVAGGTLGALQVRDIHTGVEFEIGTGLDAALRQEIWNHRPEYLYKIVKYKFLPVGVKDKPRHPVFLGIRDPIDI